MNWRELRQVDVFTKELYVGNPLAVILEADGLESRKMQAIAAEMNLSETAFVLQPTSPEADYRLRIFTPTVELPFAGHPSIGAAFVLYEYGRFGDRRSKFSVRQEVEIGVLPIEIDPTIQGIRMMMTQGEPEGGLVCDDVERLVLALGLKVDDVIETGLPVEISSTGLRQMMVPVASLKAVQEMQPDMRTLVELEREMSVTGFEVFTFDSSSDTDTHVRFFGPASGIDEDPATGSAAGALGAYLVRHGAVDTTNNPVLIVVGQGEELGRPSRIEVEVQHEVGIPKVVLVGGFCKTVLKGQLLG